jgi:hypothetical protein
MTMKDAYPHPGIRIDSIPADEGGGLIFVAGMMITLLVAVPVLRPLALIGLVAGALMAPVIHRLGH